MAVLEQENAAQQAEITTLKQQNAVWEARLAALEAQVGLESGATRQGASLRMAFGLPLGGLVLAGLAVLIAVGRRRQRLG